MNPKELHMTDSHRELGQHWLDNAIDWYGQIDDSDPWEKTTASALVAGVFFLAARDDDPLAGEEQHQSEKFEATPLDFDSRCLSWDDNSRCLLWAGHDGQHRHPAVRGYDHSHVPAFDPKQPNAHWTAADFERYNRRELDEDNPDTLVGDAGLAGDDADTIARPLDFDTYQPSFRTGEEAEANARRILDTPRTDFYGTPGPWSAA